MALTAFVLLVLITCSDHILVIKVAFLLSVYWTKSHYFSSMSCLILQQALFIRIQTRSVIRLSLEFAFICTWFPLQCPVNLSTYILWYFTTVVYSVYYFCNLKISWWWQHVCNNLIQIYCSVPLHPAVFISDFTIMTH